MGKTVRYARTAISRNLLFRAIKKNLPYPEARQDVFDYIELFYNSKRRHGYTNLLSPMQYEKQYFERLASV